MPVITFSSSSLFAYIRFCLSVNDMNVVRQKNYYCCQHVFILIWLWIIKFPQQGPFIMFSCKCAIKLLCFLKLGSERTLCPIACAGNRLLNWIQEKKNLYSCLKRIWHFRRLSEYWSLYLARKSIIELFKLQSQNVFNVSSLWDFWSLIGSAAFQ